MEYDNTNRGVLFKQEEKKNDKAPDYKGSFNHNGEEFKIAGFYTLWHLRMVVHRELWHSLMQAFSKIYTLREGNSFLVAKFL